MPLVRVFPMSSSSYASQIYAGLVDLAAAGMLELEFIWSCRYKIREKNEGHIRWDNRHLVYLEIEGTGGVFDSVCYDLTDAANIVSLDGLRHCDVYFKRSYLPDLVRRLPFKEKIRPFGLSFPSRSAQDPYWLKRTLIHHTAAGAWRAHSLESARCIARALLDWSKGRRRPSDFRIPSGDLEYRPDKRAEPLILFQTRLFDPLHAVEPGHIVELNNFRVETLRALKAAFGPRFIGGLIPNAYTLREYPECRDLLTDESTRRTDYLRLVRKCLVTVFTRGLADSNGWRLPEFLAASRCIVSQRLVYELPTPLQEGGNCLFFDTPDECVTACERLLDDRELARRMRRRNYAYYRQNVRPAAIVWNSLVTAASSTGIERRPLRVN